MKKSKKTTKKAAKKTPKKASKKTSKKTSKKKSKKPSAKKSSTRKAPKSKKPKPAGAPTPTANKGLINKQPQVQQQAAVAHAMFLYTDDAWSLQYYDPNDLHCREREVFG